MAAVNTSSSVSSTLLSNRTNNSHSLNTNSVLARLEAMMEAHNLPPAREASTGGVAGLNGGVAPITYWDTSDEDGFSSEIYTTTYNEDEVDGTSEGGRANHAYHQHLQEVARRLEAGLLNTDVGDKNAEVFSLDSLEIPELDTVLSTQLNFSG